MNLIRRAASWWNARHAQAIYSPSLQRALDERLREIAEDRERTDGLSQVRDLRLRFRISSRIEPLAPPSGNP